MADEEQTQAIEVVYMGRWNNGGKISHRLQRVDGDQLVGHDVIFGKPPGKYPRPGQVLQIQVTKFTEDGSPSVAVLASAEYVRFWDDHAAVMRWQADDEACAALLRLKRMRAEETLDVLEQTLAPFRRLYQHAGKSERAALLAVLIAAGTEGLTASSLQQRVTSAPKQPGGRK